MATLQIGRVGLDVTLPDPQGFSERSDGGTIGLSITGQIKNATTLAQAVALKEELLAQVGRVIPVTYSTDASIDGFYMLNSANVNTDRQFLPYTNFLFPFTVDLTRMDSPTWEMAYTGGLLPNSHGVTAQSNKGMCAIPATFTWAADPSGAVSSNTLACDGDDVRIYYGLDPGDTGPEYAVTPANFYDAACEIWVDSRLRAGSHRRLPAYSTVRLTNSLVRVDVGSGVANGDIEVAHYYSSGWLTALNYNIRWDGVANENGSWTECYIIRNDPEEVSVQFLKTRATIGFLAMTITLRRGWRTVLVTLFTDGTIDCGINRGASDAGTAISTYGIVDSSGTHKYLLLTPDTNTPVNLSTTAGFETTGNAGRMFIGVSMIVNAGAPDTGAGQTDLIDQFFNWLEVAQNCRGVTV